MWDCRSGECLRTWQGQTVSSVAFTSDGQTLASGSNDRTVKLWDYKSGECLQTWQGQTVSSVAFTSDGQTLASGGGDDTIKLWDVKTGKCLKTLTDRPYENMNITNITGLTSAEKATLKTLGAVENEN